MEADRRVTYSRARPDGGLMASGEAAGKCDVG